MIYVTFHKLPPDGSGASLWCFPLSVDHVFTGSQSLVNDASPSGGFVQRGWTRGTQTSSQANRGLVAYVRYHGYSSDPGLYW